jgi:antitoxin MazE
MYITGGPMRISKWGNSLAVRLPVDLVERLQLKEGDEVEFHPTDYAGKSLGVGRKLTDEEAFAELRKLRKPIPRDYKFNREELHDRKLR